MQPFLTEAYKPQAHLGLRAPVELETRFLDSMCWPAQVLLKTTGLCLLQGSTRRQSTLNYSAVAQRLLQRLLRCDTKRFAMAASIARFMESWSTSLRIGRGSLTANVIRSVGAYPNGLTEYVYYLSGTSWRMGE